jgi:hypothetical protein
MKDKRSRLSLLFVTLSVVDILEIFVVGAGHAMDGDVADILQAPISHEINNKDAGGLVREFKAARIRQISTKNLRQISPQATGIV